MKDEFIWLDTREVQNLDGKKENVITLVRPFPVASPIKAGYVAVNLKESSIVNLISELEYDDYTNVYIVNEQGKPMSSFIQLEVLGEKRQLEKATNYRDTGYFIDRENEHPTLFSFTRISV